MAIVPQFAGFIASGVIIIAFNLFYTWWADKKGLEKRIKKRSEIEEEELKEEIEEMTEGGVEE